MHTNDERKDSDGEVQYNPRVKYCGLKAKPILKDFNNLKGAIAELAVVLALFLASLAGGDFNVIIGLSITVTVLATFLILWDFVHIRKTRDYRVSTLTLITLDVIVFIASCITLHYWRLMLNGNVGNNSIDSLYALDALMLALMILIVYGRIYFKVKDRVENHFVEGVLMEEFTPNNNNNNKAGGGTSGGTTAAMVNNSGFGP